MGSAIAREYLTRLILQNEYFGDDIRLIALVNAGGEAANSDLAAAYCRKARRL